MRKWKQEEIDILTNKYGECPARELAVLFSRTESSIKHKAARLGITRQNPWIDISSQRFGRIVVIEYVGSKNGRALWHCQCDCGNKAIKFGKYLRNGNTQSCGCYQKEVMASHAKDITSRRFGQLVAIKTTREKDGSSFVWECLCDCGRTTFVPVNRLGSGNTQSCGNCQNRTNGIPTSRQQREIARIVGGQLNYKTGTRFIDVALPEEKIALEYHGWYWHKNRKGEDTKRTKELMDDGWKVITIKGRHKLPKGETITACVLSALQGQQYQELTLSDWLGYN